MDNFAAKLKHALGYIFYGNIFMSISVCAALWLTYLQLDIPLKADHLFWFVFFATWFNYTLQRLLSIRKLSKPLETPLMNWLHTQKPAQYLFLIISAVGTVYHLYFLLPELLLPLVIAGILGLSYAFPIPIGNGRKIRLRELSLLKIFLVALVWALVTVVLPAAYFGRDVLGPESLLIFGERLLFVFVLVLPFDLRDVDLDKRYEIRTIPIILGKRKTILLGTILIFMVIILEGMRLYFSGDPSIPYMTGFGLIGILTIHSLYLSYKQRHDFFYLGWVDGLPLLQVFIIWGLLQLL